MSKTFELACRILHETDNAIQINDGTSDENLWIPLSQVEEIHRDKNGYGSIVMSEWIAKQKGLL